MSEMTCPTCEGEGTVQCDRCGGRGGRWRQRYTNLDYSYTVGGFRTERESCPDSDCTDGRKPCEECEGLGTIVIDE